MKYLITGGTGTFGRAMVERILSQGRDDVVVLSRDEDKQYWMSKEIDSDRVKFVIGDVRNKESIKRHFQNVDYVFHAAAMKQVPSCQGNPMEAVMTNVIGTSNVLELAIENKVKKVVFLSTDKAVEPSSIMGMTKAISEAIALKMANNANTDICITRFGNLVMSRGSVVPLFLKQAKEEKPLTLTHERMNRFMMTVDDAIDLVMYAFRSGSNGSIFVKKAKNYNLEFVARAILRITDAKSFIKLVGIREGEKLSETLISKDEKAIDCGDFFEISKRFSKSDLSEDYSTNTVDVENDKETEKFLRGVINA